jgi:hypothetical protein
MATNNFAIQTAILASDVTSPAGTFTVSYPAGYVQADFQGANVNTADELMIVNGNDRWDGTKVDFAYGASLITVTNKTGATLKAGTSVTLKLARGNVISLSGVKGAAITALTAATGTPSDTIADVTGSFVQATLNNNFKSLADKINLLRQALKDAGITA